MQIEADRQVDDIVCDHCGTPIRRVTGFIDDDQGDALAVYWAFCHHADGGHEVFLEAVFSATWDDDVDDHVMFACRVGEVVGESHPAATLTDARPDAAPTRLTGHRLTREEGLAHDGLSLFWNVVDHILTFDPDVRTHLYG